jgi:glyoxylase-like metal-dependent hydrolase (beta-lactamase superfamily II)
MQLAPGLHRIGSDLVNAYLVEDGGGLTLIDAGIAGQWHDLTTELDRMGRRPGDIRGLVLTHGDTDHVGYAERLRRDHGVPVFVHEADAPRARGEEKKSVPLGPWKVGPLVRFMWYAARRGGLRTTWLQEVRTVIDGQVLDLPGAPRVIHVPGHTPGSIAVQVASVDAVFVGDALTTGHVLTGVSAPQPAPFTMDPAAAMSSLAKLEPISAAWVLPGHGPPWPRGLARALRLVRNGSRSGD